MIIRLGRPPFPVKVTERGTFVAKTEHVWRGARRWAEKKDHIVDESYGVVGVAPF